MTGHPRESRNGDPEWKIRARQGVDSAKRSLQRIREEAQSDVRRGLEIDRLVRNHQMDLEYLDWVIDLKIPNQALDDGPYSRLGEYMGGTVSINAQYVYDIDQDYQAHGRQKQERHDTLVRKMGYAASSSGSAMLLGAQMVSRLEEYVPDRRLLVPPVNVQQLHSHDDILDSLKHLLEPFDGRFTFMLCGSEEALLRSDVDHLSQAAHSMRDLFQQLIEALAPSDVVRQQPWFKQTPEAPGGVSRRSRLKYMLYGSGERFGEKELTQLDTVADSAKGALDLIQDRAHRHDPTLKVEEVRLAIDAARWALVTILKARDTAVT